MGEDSLCLSCKGFTEVSRSGWLNIQDEKFEVESCGKCGCVKDIFSTKKRRLRNAVRKIFSRKLLSFSWCIFVFISGLVTAYFSIFKADDFFPYSFFFAVSSGVCIGDYLGELIKLLVGKK